MTTVNHELELRELFDELVELAPERRRARLAALDLPEATSARLQSMVAFDGLIELDPGSRNAELALAQLPESVRVRVESMLAADAEVPALLQAAASEAIALHRADDQALRRSLLGGRVGNFRVHGLIGRGESALVFHAEAEAAADAGPRVVALKLLRTALYSAHAQRRFLRRFAQLKRWSHPHHAALIEAGVSAHGTPFVAMELVEGAPITQAADARGLGLERRLAWIANLCRAVEAAHAALIVHGDLKPSNVRVTATGDLKVLNLGVARLVDDDELATGAVVLSPEYAAPEQFGTEPPTTAVDVYALGVLLGELLTGKRLTGHMRASARAGAQDQAGSPLPRGLPERAALARRLRGDLDAILAKALADEPASRYRSAGALADDLERHLAGRPVHARPASRWYRARKFAARHRVGVVLAAVFVLALVTSLGIAASRAWSLAREAQRAEGARDVLLGALGAAEPAGLRFGSPTVADVVRAAIGQAQASASLRPGARVELIDSLGAALREQGEADASVPMLEQNYRNAVAALGASDPTTIEAGLDLADSRIDAGQQASARALLDQLMALATDSAGGDLQVRLLVASAGLAARRGERERALAESARAVSLCEAGCDDPTLILALVDRGDVLSSFQDESAAIPLLERAIALQRRAPGGPPRALADALEVLSRGYRRSGRLERAEALAREALSIVEASAPVPHRRHAAALDALRQVLIDARKLDEAAALGLRVIAAEEAAHGPNDPRLAIHQYTLGATYMMRGDLAQAAERFRAALAISARDPDGERLSAICQTDLGYSVGLGGDAPAGMGLIRAALARFRARAPIDYLELASALEKLGDLGRRSGDYAAALASYGESDSLYRGRLQTAPGERHARTLVGLGRTLSERGRDDAGAVRELREALSRLGAPGAGISALRIEAKTALAEVLARGGQAADSRRLLDEAVAEASAAGAVLPGDVQQLLQRAVGSIRRDGPARLDSTSP